DGDGVIDLFLAQNFFGTDPRTARYDGGRGLILRGHGNGEFRSQPASESGIRIYGEGRGAAVADYDGDGRLDLAVGQNCGQTKLYHNTGGHPGLRVRLGGLTNSMAGAGTWLRLVSGTKYGPTHEVHLGSGYWSQDSLVQVLHGSGFAQQLW